MPAQKRKATESRETPIEREEADALPAEGAQRSAALPRPAPPAPVPSSEGSGVASARRQQQQRVAQQRAAHFARAAPSSTPTGSLRPSLPDAQAGAEGEREEWPGPFSTAWAMMGRREAARQAREERRKEREREREKGEGGEREGEEDEEAEGEERGCDLTLRALPSLLPALMQQGEGEGGRSPLPSLHSLCLSLLAQELQRNGGAYERGDFSCLSDEERLSLLASLSKRGAVSVQTALLFLHPRLSLPDCSGLDEGELSLLLSSLFDPSLPALSPLSREPLSLSLRHAGRGLSDRVARALADLIGGEVGAEGEGGERGGKRRGREGKGEEEGQGQGGGEAAGEAEGAREEAGRGERGGEGRGRGRGLEALELGGCYKLSDQALLSLLSSSKGTLRTLSLHFSPRLSSLALEGLPLLCPSLLSLSLDFCAHLSDEDLAPLYHGERGLAQLDALSLRGLERLSDLSLCPLLSRYGPRLSSLCLSELPLLSPRTLVELRHRCGALRRLGLGDVGPIDPPSWLGLLLTRERGQAKGEGDLPPPPLSLGPLQELDLGGNAGVTDDAVIALARGYGRSLSSLSLRSCPLVTSRGVVALAGGGATGLEGARALRRLDASYLRGVSARALTYLLLRCAGLQSLGVWGLAGQLGGGEGAGALRERWEGGVTGGLLWESEVLRRRNIIFEGRAPF